MSSNNKKAKLLSGIRGRQLRETSLLSEEAAARINYRIVPVSLYTSQAEYLDELTRRLKKAGIPKANRSFVVQELIREKQEQFDETKLEEVVALFRKRVLDRMHRDN